MLLLHSFATSEGKTCRTLRTLLAKSESTFASTPTLAPGETKTMKRYETHTWYKYMDRSLVAGVDWQPLSGEFFFCE